MKRVLVCSDNLFLRPALERSLEENGWSAGWGVGPDDVRAAGSGLAAVLVDLGSSRVDWRSIVAAAGNVPVVAFGPHVDTGTFREATEAGCVAVVPNGRIAARAGSVLDEAVRGA